MNAPGPWAALKAAVLSMLNNGEVVLEWALRKELRAALAACPDPREADLAGEALTALDDLAALAEAAGGFPATVARARDILRRAGRI